MPLGTTLTYTTPNLNNSRNLIESNKCIDLTSCNNKDRHPRHGLPQDNGIIKSICLIRIRPNDNFLSHTRTSIRINNQWYDKPIQTSKKSTMVILKQKPQREVPQITSKNESIQKSLKKWFPFNWLAIKMLKYTRIIITLKY